MNTSFLPGTQQQFAWDSTSLSALMRCPRYYQWSIIDGWVPKHDIPALEFGIAYHACHEDIAFLCSIGYSLDAAIHGALLHAMQSMPRLDDKARNHTSLARAIVWYYETYSADVLQTVHLANGKPATELSFRFPLTEDTLLCGHLDKVVSFGDELFILDYKSTTMQLYSSYFDKYSPDNQMSLYSVAGQVVLAKPVSGVLIDATQLGVTFARFARGFANRTPAHLDEWQAAIIHHWLPYAERCAASRFWPANETACSMYGGCRFRRICASDPSVRTMFLEADFTRRVWDPLQSR